MLQRRSLVTGAAAIAGMAVLSREAFATNLTKWQIIDNWVSVTFSAGDLNTLAVGGGALSTSVYTNSTGLNVFCIASLVVTVGGTTAAGGHLDVYALPLNQDGSTYGDGYASSSSTVPTSTYFKRAIQPKVGVTASNTVTGETTPFVLAPTDYKFALGNQSIVLSSTAALTFKITTFVTNLNG